MLHVLTVFTRQVIQHMITQFFGERKFPTSKHTLDIYHSDFSVKQLWLVRPSYTNARPNPGGVRCNPSEVAYARQSSWMWTISLRLKEQVVDTALVWLTWVRVDAISKHGFCGGLPVSLRREASETIHPNWRWDARHSWCSYARRRAST